MIDRLLELDMDGRYGQSTTNFQVLAEEAVKYSFKDISSLLLLSVYLH